MGMSLPMLADFSVRLAGGLAGLLLITPWRVVPPAFFRTHSLVILGLYVLAALDAGRTHSERLLIGIMVAAAVAAYLGSIAWGLGIRRLGLPFTIAMLAGALAAIVVISSDARPAVWCLNVAGRVASAFLLGSTLSAMLLGHHYLTAPAMSIDPLKRFVACIGVAVIVRAVLAAVGLSLAATGTWHGSTPGSASIFFLAMRWGFGIGGPALAAWLSWKTVQIRSTQSATGILYIAMTFVLFGELTGMILARDTGVAM
jgi:hypothetical protein